jgi:MoaA/NifB/PqqE/SkfB family radical SAM enzyme
MKMKQIISAVCALIKVRLFKKSVPLALSWALTFRCNQRCKYCGIWKNKCEELSTNAVLSILEQFRKLGTRWVSFTGGEPLLRDDIGEIINQAKKSGMYVSISSNGRLIPDKIHQLIGIDRVKLSLDGPEQINDQLRGFGSFSAVEKAIKVCKKNNIKVCLECVISKVNLEYIDWLLDYVSGEKLKILFQPATENLLWGNEPNPVIAPIDDFKRIIEHLIARKKKGAPILNSLAGLKHLSFWPKQKKIYCSGGLLSFDVEPDGSILACDRINRDLSGSFKEGLNIKKALKEVKPINNCQKCWCSSVVEFNLIISFNFNAIVNLLRNN